MLQAYDDFDFNTAALIRDALPPVIPRTMRPSIKVYRYAIDTPCTYKFSIHAMDDIWSGRAVGIGESLPVDPVHIALHLGMRPSHPGYCIEARARKEGYEKSGEDGLPFPAQMIEAGGPWAELPDWLYSDFDMNALKDALSETLPVSIFYFFWYCVVVIGTSGGNADLSTPPLQEVDVVVSQNAGAYFCEFELWSSLANGLLKHGSRDAIFLHVPKDRSAAAIDTGANVAIEVIKAAVAQMESRRGRHSAGA
ncbi:hypothetical protein NLG97_g4941 [Lecanicillium saksenae]|uniref:Uncharacterized protein n=1 Tax=Lecanicillium saksenae TaxID=468837 RepID=A0ACC1QVK4_9HYPO|nr:hypothetical protein NLG97_g4941 [Lecanicillium saksenae]